MLKMFAIISKYNVKDEKANCIVTVLRLILSLENM